MQQSGDAQLGQRLAVLPLAVLPPPFLANGLLASVSASVSDGSALQPMAGRFSVEGEALFFVPRYPFMDGERYALLVRYGEEDQQVWTIERQPPPGVPTTEVVAIYPSSAAIPLNQLKLYIHFTSTMSEGCAAHAVTVRRADSAEPLRDVLLSAPPELWDSDHQRLTLLFDPGRIKRGLVPHEEAGYPLIDGVPIVVSIESQFLDARRLPLRAAMERHYVVGPAIRERVRPQRWRIQAPQAGSPDMLRVEFDRPLDHALLMRCIEVQAAGGLPVTGQVNIGPQERSWLFWPDLAWSAEPYDLVIDPRLEDLAGNSLARVFDRDLLRTADEPRPAALTRIPFVCPLA